MLTMMRTDRRLLLACLLGTVVNCLCAGSLQALDYQRQVILIGKNAYIARIPSGYSLEVLTTKLEGPRMLTFADDGELFIGSKSGAVYRLKPPYTRPQTLVSLNDYPHSVAVRHGELLIARTSGLYRAPYRPGQEVITPQAVTRITRLPGGRGHNSRNVRIGPDRRVYISLGISGNCSDEYLGMDYPFDKRRGGVFVLREDLEQPLLEPFASGLRNPVGFDWHPVTGVLYASNNGPDHLGYEQPPEYFSRLDPGSFHGMPWFQYDGERLQRDDCIKRQPPRPQQDIPAPAATFPARNAPMAVAFVQVGALDPQFHGDAIVALHGSWGTRPSGGSSGDRATRRPPKLVRVRFEDGEAREVEDFITGFQLQDGKRWARPAGAAVGPDGALYFTSDGGTHGLFRLQRNDRNLPRP